MADPVSGLTVDKLVEGAMSLVGIVTSFFLQRVWAHVESMGKDLVKIREDLDREVDAVRERCDKDSRSHSEELAKVREALGVERARREGLERELGEYKARCDRQHGETRERLERKT